MDSHFLDLGTSWEWTASDPKLLYSQEESLFHTHWIAGWVDPRAGRDDVQK
jgi:hypothetical protein